MADEKALLSVHYVRVIEAKNGPKLYLLNKLNVINCDLNPVLAEKGVVAYPGKVVHSAPFLSPLAKLR